MKKICLITLVLAMGLSLCACRGAASSAISNDENSSQMVEKTKTNEGVGNILVAYFSRTGNTETVAKMIAEHTKGELFKIETVTPYSDDYDTCVEQAKKEQKEKARPKLSSHVQDMNNYEVIFVGYPNWWGTMPMAVFAFLEAYDFSGKTIIPFCTHEGSAFGRSVKDIAALCPDATLLAGLSIRGSHVDDAKKEISDWLRNLNITK